MICDVCGKSKRDLLLRPTECDCDNKYVTLQTDEDKVTHVGIKENEDEQ